MCIHYWLHHTIFLNHVSGFLISAKLLLISILVQAYDNFQCHQIEQNIRWTNITTCQLRIAICGNNDINDKIYIEISYFPTW